MESGISLAELASAKERARRRLLDHLMVHAAGEASQRRARADALLPGVLQTMELLNQSSRALDEQIDVLMVADRS